MDYEFYLNVPQMTCFYKVSHFYDTIYYTIWMPQFNMDWKAECGQQNLAHVIFDTTTDTTDRN